MATQPLPGCGPSMIDIDGLSCLIRVLRDRGYEVYGPTIRDGAVVYDPIESASDLPAGWTAEQEPGRYRLRRREDGALFGFANGPQSLKLLLHPPDVRVLNVEREDGHFQILPDEQPAPKRAVIGVRACDLSAVMKLDRVLLYDRFVDRYYEERRRNLFLVAVHCTEPAGTCFCAAVGAGPEARSGFDLAMTEVLDGDSHRFLVEAGSDEGASILQDLPREAATPTEIEQAKATVREAAAKMGPVLDAGRAKEILYASLDHPRWQTESERCLACGNCTMVCPTCFCISMEDSSDMTGTRAERRRRWDSCFSLSFSYIHGGVVRESCRARHRHRVLHKLATWQEQFGEIGCTGCGRCITWCPVGIDFTEEVAGLQAATR